MWDVWDAGCGMHGMWDAWDAGCGMHGMQDVWDAVMHPGAV